jgi:dihydrofolate reductase
MFLIATMSRNHVLGMNGRRPWNVPESLSQSLAFLEDQTVILGLRSWETLGSDLGRSHNIVLSRAPLDLPGAEVKQDLDSALIAAWNRGKKIFCAGGASLFEQTLPLATKMYINYIEGDYEGDAHFPAFDEAEWEVERRRQHERFEFVLYHRTFPA